ncbi:hypothetical protein PHMEG_0003487 [Phytophthora megakarya]|uniref:M96 mating-specific protein n=1 Tax=Phytophthora megakarya TaxID=4795 RepID=A0A225WW56_9STRA|nr:hypothetical protein PHMEG_0003487 [Phytophthora megakarya]
MEKAQADPKRKGRRSVDNVAYSTALQRRRTEDLRRLRHEVQLLQQQLKLIKTQLTQKRVATPLTTEFINQQNQLAIEYKKRREAETVNEELKSIQATQTKLFTLIRRMLRKRKVSEDICTFRQLQPTIDRRLLSVGFNSAMALDLANSLERLHLEASTVFPALEDNLSVGFRSEIKNHEMFGTCVEMSTITPIACPSHQAADIVWHVTTHPENDETCKPVSTLRTNSCEQVVVIGAMKFWLPNGELHFEAPYWTVISPSLSDPSRASVMQSSYKLYTVTPTFSEELKSAHDLVLSFFGKKMRGIMQMLQNLLLDQVELGSC